MDSTSEQLTVTRDEVKEVFRKIEKRVPWLYKAVHGIGKGQAWKNHANEFSTPGIETGAKGGPQMHLGPHDQLWGEVSRQRVERDVPARFTVVGM